LGAGAVIAAALLGPVRERISADKLAAWGNLLFLGSVVGLALLNRYGLVAAAMFFGGTAWMTTMSTFNVTVQVGLPPELRARALGIYLLVFQASLALGSAAWGALAEHANVRVSLLASAAGLAISLALAAKLRLGGIEMAVYSDEVGVAE
jgi:predicted MFS family arabinose efflux permease